MGSRAETLKLRDVARAAGVSEITVSRVIRSKGPIAEETRQRVEAAIRSIGYVPNRLAGALRTTAVSELVGVVLPSLNNIVFLDVLRGLNEVLSAGGFRSVISVTEYNPEAECELVRSLLSWRPAAIIVTGRQHEAATERLLRDARVPVIELMDTDGAPIDIAIGMSHAQGGAGHGPASAGARLSALRLYRAGSDEGSARRRTAGCFRRDAARGRRATARHRRRCPSPRRCRAGAMRSLVCSRRTPPSRRSISPMTMPRWAACSIAWREGIAVPDRLAIAGFNGLDVGQLMPKPLTTTLTRRFEMGCRAGAAILDRMAGIEVPKISDLGFELIPGATA